MASFESTLIEYQVPASATAAFTAGANESKLIINLTFTNTSSSDVLLTIWRLSSSTSTPTTGSGGNYLEQYTLSPGEIWSADKAIGKSVRKGQAIFLQAGTASVINADCTTSIEYTV
jgi:hypothetical protein